MKTETILIIIILIVLMAAVVTVMMMNQGTGDVEKLQALREEIKEMKESQIASELEELRSEIKDLKENQVDEPDTIVEDEEDEVVYLKSAAVVGVQSPDTEKNNFPIESDEIRASVMESQNIVENDVKKNSETEASPRVMNKGPDSLKLPQMTMDKLKAVARKVKEKERNEEIKKDVVRPGPKAPKPTPELIRLGPPKMVRPAVCRDLPGSSFDSCGRPSSFGPVRAAAELTRRRIPV